MLKSYLHKGKIEAGCDEAGRGCLAGPVYAAAVILPKDYENELLDDSKKMTEKQRYKVREMILEDALAWAVGVVDHKEIDEINILNASFLAMHRALDQLKIQPNHILIDGNRFHAYKNIDFDCIIKGDGKFLSIAAASVLAKTFRDDYMKEIGEKHPVYSWEKNKGYPTKAHRAAIMQHGASPFHRRSFRLLPEAVQGRLF